MKKYLIIPDRKRLMEGGFAFIPRKFLLEGHMLHLSHEELSLYLLLVLASDTDGMSYYSFERICNVLKMDLDSYLIARDRLIERGYIAMANQLCQVLSLPTIKLDGDPASIRKSFQDELRIS